MEYILFRDFLRTKRKAKHRSQKQMAEYLGIDPNTVSRWELGVSSPTMDYAMELADKLGGKIVIVDKE